MSNGRHYTLEAVREQIDAAGSNGILDELRDAGDVRLLTDIATTPSFEVHTRSYAAYLTGFIADADSIVAMRRLARDRRAPRQLRTSALKALSLASHETLIEDLSTILQDKGESAWMRGEAADKIGGAGLSARLLPVLLDVLADDALPAEVALWCIYACASAPDSQALRDMLRRYLDDERTVEITFGQRLEVPVHLEATWALARLDGEDVDPRWCSHPGEFMIHEREG